MNLQHNYSVDEVLEITKSLDNEGKIKVRESIQQQLLDIDEIQLIMAQNHKKYEATYKALA